MYSVMVPIFVFLDVEVVECVQRPYEIKSHTLLVPNVGVVSEEVGRDCFGGSLGAPSVGSTSLWTAKATNKIPGHTGYLIAATLHKNSSPLTLITD